jgi:hypothetical protein
LIPPIFEKTLENESPHYSILFSSFLMAICIWTLDVKKVAKLGSSFQLIIFLVGDVAVIVYRECQHSEQLYPNFFCFYFFFLFAVIFCTFGIIHFWKAFG